MRNLVSFFIGGIIFIVALIVVAIFAILVCMMVISILAAVIFLWTVRVCLPKRVYKLSLDINIRGQKEETDWDRVKYIAISSGIPEKEVRLTEVKRELGGPFFSIFFSRSWVIEDKDPYILLEGPALLFLFSWMIKALSQKHGMQIRSVERVY